MADLEDAEVSGTENTMNMSREQLRAGGHALIGEDDTGAIKDDSQSPNKQPVEEYGMLGSV